MLTVTEDMDAKLAELEKEQASDPEFEKASALNSQPPNEDDRRPPEAPVKPEPVPPNKPEIPSDAEKAEIETATKDAEKQGHELVKDDKGKYVRDAKGKFTTKAKVPAKDPKIVGIAEQMKGWTREEAQAVLNELFPQDSKYARENSRRDNSWKALGEEKAKLADEKKAFEESVKDVKARFQADVDAFKEEQAQARPSADKYDKWSEAETRRVEELTKAAAKAEEAGEFDKAEAFKTQAAEAAGLAKRAKAMADDVRKNPPPDDKARQEQFMGEQRQWIAKAAQEFPEFGKKDSELQKGAAEYFQQVTKLDPRLLKVPATIYFCAERADLLAKANTAKAASERVSALEKENGELQAKVKELDALTNPTPAGGVARVNPQARQSSDDEEYEELRRMAATMGR